MKKLLIPIAVLLISFAFSFKDSEAAPRNVLLEFCTGTWCGYCPCGDVALETIKQQFPRTIGIAYHGASSDPWQNFTGYEVRSLLGFTAYPTAIIDRGNTPNNPYVTYDVWYGKVESRYTNSPESMVDIAVTSKSFDVVSRQLTMTLNATALQNLEGQYKISVVVVENNVIYPQNFYASCGTPGYQNDYVHNDIARIMTNGPTGENLNTDPSWTANQTFTRNITATIDDAWVAANCKIIAFVYKDNSTLALANVEQAIETDLMMTGISQNNNVIPENYSLSQNYPNPFNPTTNIQFSIPKGGNVSFKVYDIFGKEVSNYLDGYLNAGSYNIQFDGSNLSSGTYFYILKSDNFTDQKKMIMVK